MKQLLTFLLVIICLSVSAQFKSFDSTWQRSLYRSFVATEDMYQDSCYRSYTLLKIDIDKNSRITSIHFSDNADSAVKQAFGDLKKHNHLLEKAAKQNNIKNISLILPITIVAYSGEGSVCTTGKQKWTSDTDLHRFNQKYLEGRCLFLQPFSTISWISCRLKRPEMPAKLILRDEQ